ncbi:MAG: hypothetical protein ACRYG8_44850, partial [Janthinobacterium lividum]
MALLSSGQADSHGIRRDATLLGIVPRPVLTVTDQGLVETLSSIHGALAWALLLVMLRQSDRNRDRDRSAGVVRGAADLSDHAGSLPFDGALVMLAQRRRDLCRKSKLM